MCMTCFAYIILKCVEFNFIIQCTIEYIVFDGTGKYVLITDLIIKEAI